MSKNTAELSRYQLELEVKELRAQLQEMDGLQEKLNTANRSCRVLEEENVQLRLASPQRTTGPEAQKLLKENAALEDTISRIKSEAAAEKEALKKEVDALQTVCEQTQLQSDKYAKELDAARHQYVETKRLLDSANVKLVTLSAEWEDEKEQYIQKIDNLQMSLKKKGSTPASTTTRPSSSLQEKLLRDEVAELEEKLKATQQQLWKKEKEWIQQEEALKEEIASASEKADANTNNNSEVYLALQAQITALKDELSASQRQTRSSRAFANISIDAFHSPSEDTVAYVPTHQEGDTSAIREGSSSQNTTIAPGDPQELYTLSRRLEECNEKVRRLQADCDQKDVRCRELEADLARAKANEAKATKAKSPEPSRRAPSESARQADELQQQLKQQQQQHQQQLQRCASENAALKKELRDAKSDLNSSAARLKQNETIHAAQAKEYKKQIDELLREIDRLRARAEDAEDAIAALPIESTPAPVVVHSSPDGEHVVRLTKDKRDCVEDVMRLLELSWDGDDELKRELRKARLHIAQLLSQLQAKDEEIAALRKALEDLEQQLRDLARENDKLADDLRKKEDQVEDLEREVDQLTEQLNDALAELDQLRDELAGKDDEIADLKSKHKAKKADGDNLAKRVEELQAECDRLRKKLDEAQRQQRQLMSQSPRAAAPAVVPSQSRPPIELSPRSSDDGTDGLPSQGAHFAVTIVELADLMRNGKAITEPGYVTIKLKSIKEKYKTSVLQFSSVIKFDETFVFYLAQPDQDVITMHVFYKTKGSSREYHLGDACFSMATLHRGVPRQRIAPVVQNPGTKGARRSGLIEVTLQSDDFGKMTIPTAAEVEREANRFNDLVRKFQSSAPEKLHAVDVYAASNELSA